MYVVYPPVFVLWVFGIRMK